MSNCHVCFDGKFVSVKAVLSTQEDAEELIRTLHISKAMYEDTTASKILTVDGNPFEAMTSQAAR